MGLKCIVCGSYYTKQSKESFHKFPQKPKRGPLRTAWLTATGKHEEDLKSNSAVCSRHFREIDFDSYAWPKRQLLPNIVPSPSSSYLKPSPSPTTIRSNQIVKHSSSIPNLRNNTPPPIIFVTVKQENNVSAADSPRTEDEDETAVAPFQVQTSAIRFSSVPPLVPLIESNKQENNTNNNTDLSKIGDKQELVVFSQIPRRVRIPRYVGDLTEEDFSIPSLRKQNLQMIFNTVEQQKKKIKRLQIHNLRLEKRLKFMENVIQCMRKNRK